MLKIRYALWINILKTAGLLFVYSWQKYDDLREKDQTFFIKQGKKGNNMILEEIMTDFQWKSLIFIVNCRRSEKNYEKKSFMGWGQEKNLPVQKME